LDDAWLDEIQQPAQAERLLEAFARASGVLPGGARRVRKRKALPDELQRIVSHAVAHAWVAFSSGSDYWLFTGVVSVALTRLLKAPVLQVNSYAKNGTLIDAGAWTFQRDTQWSRVDS
jgi:hypothetical protein